eukprot:4925245-Pleurochrysis_carterae.AAC.2
MTERLPRFLAVQPRCQLRELLCGRLAPAAALRTRGTREAAAHEQRDRVGERVAAARAVANGGSAIPPSRRVLRRDMTAP